MLLFSPGLRALASLPCPADSCAQNRVEVQAGDLRFSKLSLQDSGMYQCVAENKHGTVYASAELAVQGKTLGAGICRENWRALPHLLTYKPIYVLQYAGAYTCSHTGSHACIYTHTDTYTHALTCVHTFKHEQLPEISDSF